VLEWLDDVDLYLQPSFQEGLPRALVEALSRACPALGSTAGGIPELLPPECLHEPGDARRLAELVAAAVGDADWLAQQAAASFETAKRYRRPALERVRADFWEAFAAHARAAS
jgi:glycosyltransferase involved in cell wall biosynthesis